MIECAFENREKTNPISTQPPPNHAADYKNAKQTQFRKTQKERKYLWTRGLYKYTPSPAPKKQTQFRTTVSTDTAEKWYWRFDLLLVS